MRRLAFTGIISFSLLNSSCTTSKVHEAEPGHQSLASRSERDHFTFTSPFELAKALASAFKTRDKVFLNSIASAPFSLGEQDTENMIEVPATAAIDLLVEFLAEMRWQDVAYDPGWGRVPIPNKSGDPLSSFTIRKSGKFWTWSGFTTLSRDDFEYLAERVKRNSIRAR